MSDRSSIGGLVLTLKKKGRVIINKGEIVIELVQIKGGEVRLAIKAHKEIDIQRGAKADEGKNDF